MCALEEIPDSDAKDIAQIAGQLPESNLFKTNLLGLAYLSAKALDVQRLAKTGGNRASPTPRDVKGLVKCIRYLHDEIQNWLSVK